MNARPIYHLVATVRDDGDHYHRAGEAVTVERVIPRADFDYRRMFTVRFSDRSKGIVFDEEIEPSSDREIS